MIIAGRFCGPPESGNGGYVCGLLAARLGSPVEVTLRHPPPLDKHLQCEHRADGLDLLDGGTLIAEARSVEFELDAPPAPSLADAAEAERGYRGLHAHPYPRCFVCGPERQPADGLRIFAGPYREGGVAAQWTPDRSLTGEDGCVRSEFLWAALDCPGYFAAAGERLRPMLLGRMTAHLSGPDVRADEPCIIVGWPLGGEGRKHQVGTALYAADGRLRGVARATWIELRPAAA